MSGEAATGRTERAIGAVLAWIVICGAILLVLTGLDAMVGRHAYPVDAHRYQ